MDKKNLKRGLPSSLSKHSCRQLFNSIFHVKVSVTRKSSFHHWHVPQLSSLMMLWVIIKIIRQGPRPRFYENINKSIIYQSELCDCLSLPPTHSHYLFASSSPSLYAPEALTGSPIRSPTEGTPSINNCTSARGSKGLSCLLLATISMTKLLSRHVHNHCLLTFSFLSPDRNQSFNQIDWSSTLILSTVVVGFEQVLLS